MNNWFQNQTEKRNRGISLCTTVREDPKFSFPENDRIHSEDNIRLDNLIF
jgi:hypothetical protein